MIRAFLDGFWFAIKFGTCIGAMALVCLLTLAFIEFAVSLLGAGRMLR